MASAEKIEIYPFGDVLEAYLDQLADGLAAFFKISVRVNQKIKLPAGSLDPHRGQHRSQAFLSALKSLRQKKINDSSRAPLFLGITGKDLFIPKLNYIFGEADIEGAAIISYFRLRPEFYEHPCEPSLLKERMFKEAVHETGHMLGMNHCENPACIMHFSTSVRDTDIKGPGFCGRCLALFQEL